MAEEQAGVAAETAGRVVSTPIERGTPVSEGAELIRLSATETEAQLKESEANAAQIEARLDPSVKLLRITERSESHNFALVAIGFEAERLRNAPVKCSKGMRIGNRAKQLEATGWFAPVYKRCWPLHRIIPNTVAKTQRKAGRLPYCFHENAKNPAAKAGFWFVVQEKSRGTRLNISRRPEAERKSRICS